MSSQEIEIVGARTHNLKNVSVRIPLGRLTVITGPSGSGKSSLAFDTLYAEGQRRFVESLSTYARQFIEKMARPDVDRIANIPPAIAIEQKNSVKNARSTIGTATEIADYLRLLFARAGVTVCPDCGLDVREDSPQSVTAALLERLPGQRLYIVAPLEMGGKVSGEALRQELLRAGFTRVYAGSAVPPPAPAKGRRKKGARAAAVAEAPAPPLRPILDLEETDDPRLEAVLESSTVRVLVDRVVADPADRDRLSSSIATAFQAGKGTMEVIPADAGMTTDEPAAAPPPTVRSPNPGLRSLTFHAGFRCNGCGRSFPRPEPNLFSFNNPLGACPDCSGFGRVTGVDWEKVFPDRTLPLSAHPIAPFNSPSYRSNYGWLKRNCEKMGVPWNVPLERLSEEQMERLKFGHGSTEGVQEFFDALEQERYKVQSRILAARYRGYTACPRCRGTRLKSDALNVLWAPESGALPRRHIGQISKLSLSDLLAEFESVTLTRHEEELIGRVFREILSRLRYLVRVGLGYLTLDRQTRTLSGGEAQRINLATALGTALTRTLYVLDEPTVGLHPRDSRRLLEILRALRDRGNTVVVVEHEPELILGADHLIDIGPRAGSGGGRIVFAGSPDELGGGDDLSLTARYLNSELRIQNDESKKGAKASAKKASPARKSPAGRPSSAAPGSCPSPHVTVVNAREHNLKGVTARIPLHRWVCVTGVSGSGKSTLVHKVLYQGFNLHAKRGAEEPGLCDAIEGLDQIDEILLVDQSPIGRSIRSNPVTYVKAWEPIRKLLASTREARALGLRDSSFSFNVKGGRCEVCEGTGVTTYDMHFLAEVTLPCEACGGKRFEARVLQAHYRGRNVDDILSMTVDDATEFFAEEPTIIRRLAPLRDVGLGYLTLGQNTATLSGGEAQRLKLASHLATGGPVSARRTMMIFDEPTTGLSLSDLNVLSRVFRRLVEEGYSLVIIEHNLEIIRQADWILDLGPEGGDGGGELIAQGPPEAIAAEPRSHTGRFLKELL